MDGLITERLAVGPDMDRPVSSYGNDSTRYFGSRGTTTKPHNGNRNAETIFFLGRDTEVPFRFREKLVEVPSVDVILVNRTIARFPSFPPDTRCSQLEPTRSIIDEAAIGVDVYAAWGLISTVTNGRNIRKGRPSFGSGECLPDVLVSLEAF